MIDWFPTHAADPARGLARWQGLLALRRTARSIDALDPSTVGHSERVAEVAAGIATTLGWPARVVAELHEAGVVHDVGKARIPEPILMTPGVLTPSEFEIVKLHAAAGADAAAPVLSRRQASWIRHHHERWDGRGYPDGLAGDEIPAGAAALCLADSWDAMTHRSWSREALAPEAALAECRAERGGQFAPWAVDALEEMMRGAPGRQPGPRAGGGGAPLVPA
jgi:HD-GYP domain-containing protein (c-di-GMP phosphodiesterase class II)